MTLEILDKSCPASLHILQSRPVDGRKYVPIVKRLEDEIASIQSKHDDYERLMRLEPLRNVYAARFPRVEGGLR